MKKSGGRGPVKRFLKGVRHKDAQKARSAPAEIKASLKQVTARKRAEHGGKDKESQHTAERAYPAERVYPVRREYPERVYPDIRLYPVGSTLRRFYPGEREYPSSRPYPGTQRHPPRKTRRRS